MANIIDKYSRLQGLSPEATIELELGCGEIKRRANAIGIDLLDTDSVDVVGDVYDVLHTIPDGAVSAVYSYHFFEHLDDPGSLLRELGRVVKPHGTLTIVVPHFSNPFFYSDPTHKSTFGLYSFSYLCHDQVFTRRVPNYDNEADFTLVNARLNFGSYRPQYVRHAVKRALGSIVNLSRYSKEFYEENLPWLLPCYEIEFSLQRHSSP